MSALAPSCWIVTDGAVGHVKQCAAVAHYLGCATDMFRVSLRQPWDALAPYWQVGGRRAITGTLAERMRGRLPDLLLTAGRRAVLASVTIRRLSGGRTFTVQLLDPKLDPRRFDVVVCPRHDELTGPNVIPTLGALHDVDEETLAAARQAWREAFEDRTPPRVAVLIGASNRAFRLTEAHLEDLAATAERIAGSPRSLLVTTAPRTPADLRNFVKRRFADALVWTGEADGPNPYRGMLAWADHLIVSADSVNMLSEALGTGKPVYCTPPGPGSPKFASFLDALRHRGMLHALADAPLEATYEPLRETPAVAAEVMRRMEAVKSGG